MKRAFPPEFTPLLSEQQIAGRIAQLGRQITADYRDKSLTALVVLKGSFMFCADLLRQIDVPLHVEFMGLRSYGNKTSSSGVVQITMDTKHPLEGEHVLIIEDIVDTGLTLDYLKNNLSTRNPASIALATLLHKPARQIKDVPIDYLGFEIEDKFVVGYGLDFAGKYRNLPEIGYLDPPPI